MYLICSTLLQQTPHYYTKELTQKVYRPTLYGCTDEYIAIEWWYRGIGGSIAFEHTITKSLDHPFNQAMNE